MDLASRVRSDLARQIAASGGSQGFMTLPDVMFENLRAFTTGSNVVQNT